MSEPAAPLFADDPRKTHDFRYGLLFLVGLAVVAVGLYAVGFFVAGNKVPSGTTIAGVDVGGMTPDEATTALQAELAPRIERPIRAVVAGRTYSLDPQRAGLAYDIDATISTALRGSSWDPRHMLAVLLGGHDVKPVVIVDEAELDAVMRRIAAAVERPPQNAGVSFVTGGPQVRFGRLGQRLDTAHAKAALIAALRDGRRHAALPVVQVQPDVTDDEASAFAGTAGERAVTGSIRIRVADATVKLKPAVFVPALTTRVTGSGLRLSVDAHRLFERSHSAIASLPHSPVNAGIRLGSHGPVVVPARSGTTVTQRDWAAGVLTALGRDTRRAGVKPTPEAPRFTTHDARRLGIKARIGSDSARLPSVPYADLARAARQLDGALLKPGDGFSFLDTVDARYNEQAASLVAGAAYTAAFRAGLTVLSRTPVVYDTGTFPRGLGARVVPPSHDLTLRNDSPYGVYISASVRRLAGSAGGLVTVDVWGSAYRDVVVQTSSRHSVVRPATRVVRSGRCTPRPGISGYAVDVTRTFWRSGKPIGSDVTHTRYAPLDRVKCR
jgi:vancomycin resistance protein YoaR